MLATWGICRITLKGFLHLKALHKSSTLKSKADFTQLVPRQLPELLQVGPEIPNKL